MNRIFFIIFMLSAAAMDRHMEAGIMCVCAAAVLLVLSRIKTGEHIVVILIITQEESETGHADGRADKGKDISESRGFQGEYKTEELERRKVRLFQREHDSSVCGTQRC